MIPARQLVLSKKGVFWRGVLPSYTYSNWTEQLVPSIQCCRLGYAIGLVHNLDEPILGAENPSTIIIPAE